MPSPFPGMDPYLEGSLWPSVHAQLAVEIARQLSPRLVPRYIALNRKRFVRAATTDGQPIPQTLIEIRDTSERRTTTLVQVLSPENKMGGGRAEYLETRRKLLVGAAHLMEIDLVRDGGPVLAVDQIPTAPYFVILSRVDTTRRTHVWPIPLRHPLPVLPVPLGNGEADVSLDLQSALTSVYDNFGYSSAINYARPPEIPLSPADSEWAIEQIDLMRRQREHPSE